MPTTPNSLMSRYFLAIVAVWRSNTRDHGGLVPAIVIPVCDMKRVGSTAERLEKTPHTQRVCMWENYPGCLPSPDDVHRSTSAQRWRAHQGDISRPEIGANGSLLGPTPHYTVRRREQGAPAMVNCLPAAHGYGLPSSSSRIGSNWPVLAVPPPQVVSAVGLSQVLRTPLRAMS